VAELAGQLVDHRQHEDQVRREQPQVPPGGVVVVHGDLHHQAVQRQRPRVVGDDQRAAVLRDVLDALHLDTEVLLVHRPQQGHEHLVGEFGVETEVVDLVVTGEPLAQERETARDPAFQAAAVLYLGGPLGRLLLLPCHSYIIRAGRPSGEGLDLPGFTNVPDDRTVALAPAPRTPPARWALHGASARPVVVERNDLGIRHR
jgi:hypothetical protein